MRPHARALAAATLVLAVGACGTPSPDLFVVHRDGTVPGAKLDLLVSDTTARCNRGPVRPLTSDQILEARDITKDLLDVQSGAVAVPPSPPAQIFRFSVRTEDGTLRYADATQRPQVLPRLSRFVRRVAIDVCGLRR
ncbi:MAG: hypothetical protein ACR2H2_14725 [Solirubrobacteraceae bacterium]